VLKITFNELKSLATSNKKANLESFSLPDLYCYLAIKTAKTRYKQGMTNAKQATEELNAIEFSYNQQKTADEQFNDVICTIGKTVNVKLTANLTINATVKAAIKSDNGYFAEVIGTKDKTLYRVSVSDIIKEA